MVKDFKDGTSFKGLLLIQNVSRGVTNNGDAYLNLTLQDRTGHIEAKKWKIEEKDVETFALGNVCMIEGEVILYKTELQMKVLSGYKVDLTPGELDEFLESAPVSRQELMERFASYLNEIDNKQIKSVVDEIFKDILTSFSIYPAASKNHHEYVSGLIYHTVSMLDLAKAIYSLYNNIDKNYLYAGIILHDVGKIEELTGPSVPKYTTKGKLIGHISICHGKVVEACNKLKVDEEIQTILEHIVLSHHGEKEFGSPVNPATKEAEIIHLIDNIDSKINMIDKALADTKEGEFSARVPALENRQFYKPKKTN